MVEESADLGGQDEALKELVASFRLSPDAASFHELAGALLARGHAFEALGVAERGLQAHPQHVEGRLERARALLALDRPRVAYVELCRTLAIAPKHPQAMRLLGKTFKHAGAPARAAALLKQRSAWARPLSSGPAQTEASRTPPTQDFMPAPALASQALSDELGLSTSLPPQELRQVEVTQVIRRRIVANGRGDFSGIQGPIVDTSQPGLLLGEPLKTPVDVLSPPRPLFDAHPSLLDETGEPMLNELRFQVRRVIGEPDPDEIASQDLPQRTPARRPDTAPTQMMQTAPTPPPMLPPGPGPAAVERSRRRPQPALRVSKPPLTVGRLLLAAGLTLLMLGYAAGLAATFEREVEIWLSDGPKGQDRATP